MREKQSKRQTRRLDEFILWLKHSSAPEARDQEKVGRDLLRCLYSEYLAKLITIHPSGQLHLEEARYFTVVSYCVFAF